MKSVKADRKLIQRLLNAVTVGRPVEMDSIMKHELSTVPLSIAKVGGDMHSTSKVGCKQIKNRSLYPHQQTHLPGQRKLVCYHLSGQDYPQFQKPVFNL